VIYNRPFFIYGCDEFTRDYYKERYGLEFKDIPMEFEPREPRPMMEVPPPLPLGMGDEIDSLGSFLYLIPQAPRKDLRKMMENDRKLLRFMARLETAKPEDVDRVFVIKVFLADDSIAVFEPPQKNSGMVGGKFLERGFIKNPETGERFEAKDFFTGARVRLNGFPFIVYQADEFTLSYMEAHPDIFPMSDVEYVTGQLREAFAADGGKRDAVKAALEAADMGGDMAGHVGYQTFQDALGTAGVELHEQPLVTLMRYFHIDSADAEGIDYKALMRALEA